MKYIKGKMREIILIIVILVIGIVLLIANAIWKCKLMKDEQALIAGGKETVA